MEVVSFHSSNTFFLLLPLTSLLLFLHLFSLLLLLLLISSSAAAVCFLFGMFFCVCSQKRNEIFETYADVYSSVWMPDCDCVCVNVCAHGAVVDVTVAITSTRPTYSIESEETEDIARNDTNFDFQLILLNVVHPAARQFNIVMLLNDGIAELSKDEKTKNDNESVRAGIVYRFLQITSDKRCKIVCTIFVLFFVL